MAIKKKIITVPKNILAMIKKNSCNNTIKLDVGCGSSKQEGFVGLDIRPCEGVDIVHNCEQTPYPLPDGCCSIILASHLVEHIKPWLIIDIMNEWWRLLEVGGQLWLSMPYAGSFGFFQDPTHIKTWNEATATYFSPKEFLYEIYRPKPFQIIKNNWSNVGNLEIVFSKLSEEEGKKIYDAMRASRKEQGIVYGK